MLENLADVQSPLSVLEQIYPTETLDWQCSPQGLCTSNCPPTETLNEQDVTEPLSINENFKEGEVSICRRF